MTSRPVLSQWPALTAVKLLNGPRDGVGDAGSVS